MSTEYNLLSIARAVSRNRELYNYKGYTMPTGNIARKL